MSKVGIEVFALSLYQREDVRTRVSKVVAGHDDLLTQLRYIYK